MMRIRTVFAAFLFLLPLVDLPALDWGWGFRAETGLQSLFSLDRPTYWGWGSLEQANGKLVDSEWSLNLAANFVSLVDTEISLNQVWTGFDVERFEFQWSPTLMKTDQFQLHLSVGRKLFFDPSRSVLWQTLDGVSFILDSDRFESRFEIGYQGLVMKWNSLMILNNADATDFKNDANLWGAARAVAMASATWDLSPEIVFSGAVLYERDLREFVAPSSLLSEHQTLLEPLKGGPFHSAYTELGFKAEGDFPSEFQAILQRGETLLYSTTSTPNQYQKFAITATSIFAALGPSFFDRSLSIQGLVQYSSGDDRNRQYYNEGASTSANQSFLYKPLSPSPVAFVFSAQPGNLTFWGVRIVWSAFQNVRFLDFVIENTTKTFQRSFLGPIDSEVGNIFSNDYSLGWENDVSLTWKPWSDVKVQGRWGFFSPNNQIGSYWQGVKASWENVLSFSCSWDW